MSIGMPGRRGFDTAKEIAKEYPHKWSSATLYREFMRVIRRKYPLHKHKIYRQILNDTFNEHAYITDDVRMSLMGTGPTSLGSLAVEEEFYEKGLKHPQHPHRYDMIDILCSAMDSKKIHSLPYLVQRDIWYYFGLGEQQQDILSTKVHKICKNMNEKYSEISAEERDYHRQWLLKRLNLFEDSTREKNKRLQMTQSDLKNDQKMVEEIFEFLDTDNDGIIKYGDLHSFLVNTEYHNTEYIEISDMLSVKSSMRLYPESWFYMCDVLYNVNEFQTDFPKESVSEIEANKKHYQYSFINPLYQKNGWTMDHLTKVYLEYGFFDLKEHYSRLQWNVGKYGVNDVLRNERIYNLLADVSLNVCSHHLIVNHTLSTGEHLYCHILDADQDPDQITWDKLEVILEKSASDSGANDNRPSSKEILKKAREKEEIVPQDVLFYDPDSSENNSEILDSLPEHSIFWHAIFEDQLPDIPEHIIQDYFDTVVKPCHVQFESNSELVLSDFERNLLIEQHVYSEMEQHLQKWLWKRYATKCMYPAFAIQKWTRKNLLSHILPDNNNYKQLLENTL